jgi:putative oxidoreductase
MPMTHGAAWGALVLRVVRGLVFVMHAYELGALLGPRDLTRTIVGQGIPRGVVPVIVWYTILAQLAGGALLIVGLWTRLAAVLNLPILLGSLVLLHLPQGFFMRAAVRDSSGRATVVGYELSLLVLACTIAVALLGAGPYSLDDRRLRPGRRRRA